MKKLLSTILCFCLIFACFTAPAMAEVDFSGLIAEYLTTEVSTAISKNLSLPAAWQGVPITWESSNTSVISDKGIVTRLANDETVTLAAKYNGEAMKEFTFTVLASSKKVWYSENFYRPTLVGDEIKCSDAAAESPLDFKEYDNEIAIDGRAGFFKNVTTADSSDTELAVSVNPVKENDYALKNTSKILNMTNRPGFYFKLPGNSYPSGKVTFQLTLTTTGYDGVSQDKKNAHRYIEFYDKNDEKINYMYWLNAGNASISLTTSTNIVKNLTKIEANGGTYSSRISLELDFDNNTLSLKESSDGTLTAISYTISDFNELKAIDFRPRTSTKTLTNPDFYIDDVVLVSDKSVSFETPDTQKIRARYATDDRFDIIMPFNDTYEQHHILTFMQDPGLETNGGVDFREVDLVNKNNSSDKIILVNAGDEKTPFHVNASYIGASHGQASGVVITTAEPHGKTPADVGSRWKDSEGNNWNLLRIESETELLFLSDYIGKATKFSFLQKPANENNNVTLTHGGEAADKSDAVNKADIVGTITTTDKQLYRAFKTPVRTVYAVNNGVRTAVPEVGELGRNKYVEADSFEIDETYDIINPTTIADALREGRTYTETENPDIAVGEGMIRLRLTYVFTNDGTVLTIMNHEALVDLEDVSYGGIQYYQRDDVFGGGIYRYVPKTKPFTANAYSDSQKKELGYQLENVDVTTPYHANVDIRPSRHYFTTETWEDADNPPDREIQYYNDAQTNKFKLAFAGGYLPIDDGRAEIRKTKAAEGAYYYYRTNKGYPQFVRKLDMKKGDTIKGVAYKKFAEIESNDHNYTSVYSIPYDDARYYYIDYHKSGSDTIKLPESFRYEVVEKSENMSYTSEANILTATADCTDASYGYLVLKATHSETTRITDGKYNSSLNVISVAFENATNANETVTAVAASYDETGKLIESVTIPNITVNANTKIKKGFVFTKTEPSTIKLFAFDSLGTLMPWAKGHYVKIQ